jgi:hypothetical protein
MLKHIYLINFDMGQSKRLNPVLNTDSEIRIGILNVTDHFSVSYSDKNKIIFKNNKRVY